MTDEEYKGIYDILNGIKEDVNELKLKYTQNSGKLESLGKNVQKLSDDHEKLRSVLYVGDYGKKSLLEDSQRSHAKIQELESKLAAAKQEIDILQDRWIKLLWATSISVAMIMLSGVVTVAVREGRLPQQLRPVSEFLGKIDL